MGQKINYTRGPVEYQYYIFSNGCWIELQYVDIHMNSNSNCCTLSVNDVIVATNGTLPVMSTSVTLGALIGLLAAALVVVVTGWIVSCVYLQRKINK